MQTSVAHVHDHMFVRGDFLAELSTKVCDNVVCCYYHNCCCLSMHTFVSTAALRVAVPMFAQVDIVNDKNARIAMATVSSPELLTSHPVSRCVASTAPLSAAVPSPSPCPEGLRSLLALHPERLLARESQRDWPICLTRETGQKSLRFLLVWLFGCWFRVLVSGSGSGSGPESVNWMA